MNLLIGASRVEVVIQAVMITGIAFFAYGFLSILLYMMFNAAKEK